MILAAPNEYLGHVYVCKVCLCGAALSTTYPPGTAFHLCPKYALQLLAWPMHRQGVFHLLQVGPLRCHFDLTGRRYVCRLLQSAASARSVPAPSFFRLRKRGGRGIPCRACQHQHRRRRHVDLLRGLLGDDKLNYFGYSYGLAGRLVRQRFPPKVGRMVATARWISPTPRSKSRCCAQPARQRGVRPR